MALKMLPKDEVECCSRGAAQIPALGGLPLFENFVGELGDLKYRIAQGGKNYALFILW